MSAHTLSLLGDSLIYSTDVTHHVTCFQLWCKQANNRFKEKYRIVENRRLSSTDFTTSQILEPFSTS